MPNFQKLYIAKKDKKTVSLAIKQIKKLDAEQTKIYRTLLKKLGMKDGTPAEEILFDHIHNGSDWMIEYVDIK